MGHRTEATPLQPGDALPFLDGALDLDGLQPELAGMMAGDIQHPASQAASACLLGDGQAMHQQLSCRGRNTAKPSMAVRHSARNRDCSCCRA
jgi:hypothetical protein